MSRKVFTVLLLLLFASPPLWAQTAGVYTEYWSNTASIVNVAGIQALVDNPNLLGNPTGTVTETAFYESAAKNWADNYVKRMLAIITPPVTANYTFWVAGDQFAAVYLSNDGVNFGTSPICKQSAPFIARYWTRYPEQKSAPITLVGGQSYYLMTIQVETTGTDNIAVGWSWVPPGLTATTYERPIPVGRCLTWAYPPTLELSGSPDIVAMGESSLLTWTGYNLTSCVASTDYPDNSWQGARPPSGSQQVTPDPSVEYILNCSGPGGNVSRTVVIYNSSTAILAWDRNPGLVGGYKLHFGNSPGVYYFTVNVGDVDTFVLRSFAVSGPTYFAVSAYNTEGMESGYSNEVSKTIILPPEGGGSPAPSPQAANLIARDRPLELAQPRIIPPPRDAAPRPKPLPLENMHSHERTPPDFAMTLASVPKVELPTDFQPFWTENLAGWTESMKLVWLPYPEHPNVFIPKRIVLADSRLYPSPGYPISQEEYDLANEGTKFWYKTVYAPTPGTTGEFLFNNQLIKVNRIIWFYLLEKTRDYAEYTPVCFVAESTEMVTYFIAAVTKEGKWKTYAFPAAMDWDLAVPGTEPWILPYNLTEPDGSPLKVK